MVISLSFVIATETRIKTTKSSTQHLSGTQSVPLLDGASRALCGGRERPGSVSLEIEAVVLCNRISLLGLMLLLLVL